MLTLETARLVYSVSDSTVLQLVIVVNVGTVAVDLLALYNELTWHWQSNREARKSASD